MTASSLQNKDLPGRQKNSFAPLSLLVDRDRLHAALDNRRAGGGRGEKCDQRATGIGLFGCDDDTASKYRVFLWLRWQRPDDIDTRHWQHFADLLEADLGVTARHHTGHRLGWD